MHASLGARTPLQIICVDKPDSLLDTWACHHLGAHLIIVIRVF
jgi:hypothetical protein